MEPTQRVRILHDPDASNPRDNDNVGTIACWSRRYKLGDHQPSVEPKEYVESLPKGSLVLPVYMMDHSGISLSTGSYSCPWDSGQVGYIHVSPKKMVEEFGGDIGKIGTILAGEPVVSDKVRKQAQKCLESEIEEYSMFVSGETYGFVIEESAPCDKGHDHWEQIDSCWSFLGRDPFENGMSAYVPEALHEALREAEPEYR